MATNSKKPATATAAKKSAAKPAAKKAVTASKKTPAATTKKAAPAPTKKPVAPKTGKPAAPKKNTRKVTVTPEERYNMVATAAYYRAEKRGFATGNEWNDWVASEAEINAILNG